MDQHLSFSSPGRSKSKKPSSRSKKSAAVTPQQRDRKEGFDDVEFLPHSGSKSGIRSPVAYMAPQGGDGGVIIKVDRVSARRRRALRRKTCRDWFCGCWLTFISLLLLVTCFFYFTEESSADLLVRIKSLDDRLTAEEFLQADNHQTLNAREADNNAAQNRAIGEMSDRLEVQILRINVLEDAEAAASIALNNLFDDHEATKGRTTFLETELDFTIARVRNLEADSGETIERTKELEALANKTIGRTQTLEILMGDSIQRIDVLEETSDLTVQRVGALETLTNSTEARTSVLELAADDKETRVTFLEGLSASNEGRLDVVETELTNTTARTGILEAASYKLVLGMNATRDALLPDRQYKRMVDDNDANPALHLLTTHANNINDMIALQIDGWVATASLDKTIKVWDTNTGVKKAHLDEFAGAQDASHSSSVNSLVLLTNGDFCSGGAQFIIRWSMETGLPKRVHMWHAHDQDIHAMVLVPTNLLNPTETLVTTGEDGWIRTWNPAVPPSGVDTEPELEWEAHDGLISALALLRDNNRIVSGGRDGVVKVWAGTDAIRSYPADPNEFVNAIVILPNSQTTDKRRIAVAYSTEIIRIWDSDSEAGAGAVLATYRYPDRLGSVPIHSLAVLPDLTLVSGDANGIIKLWNTATTEPDGENWQTLTTERNRAVQTMVVTAQGTLVTAGYDFVATVWRNGYSEHHLAV